MVSQVRNKYVTTTKKMRKMSDYNRRCALFLEVVYKGGGLMFKHMGNFDVN